MYLESNWPSFGARTHIGPLNHAGDDNLAQMFYYKLLIFEVRRSAGSKHTGDSGGSY